MKASALYVLSAIYVLVGDYYCFQAAKSECLWWLLIPALCWGCIGPFTWYFIFQEDGFAKGNVIGGVSVALISVAIGLFIFREVISIQKVFGLLLGLISIVLLA